MLTRSDVVEVGLFAIVFLGIGVLLGRKLHNSDKEDTDGYLIATELWLSRIAELIGIDFFLEYDNQAPELAKLIYTDFKEVDGLARKIKPHLRRLRSILNLGPDVRALQVITAAVDALQGAEPRDESKEKALRQNAADLKEELVPGHFHPRE
jgi:hypothetical protein